MPIMQETGRQNALCAYINSVSFGLLHNIGTQWEYILFRFHHDIFFFLVPMKGNNSQGGSSDNVLIDSTLAQPLVADLTTDSHEP
jgi:hypothetical protein